MIATGDAERRRLERDLHDGAQQRLVGLSLQLGLTRSRLGSAAGRCARWHRSTRPRPSSTPHSMSCASSLTGSSRRCSPKKDSPPRSKRSRRKRPVEIEIGALPQSPRRVRRSGRLLRRLRSDQTQPEHPGPARGESRGRPARGRARSRHRGRARSSALEDRVGAAGGTLEVARQADGRTRIRAEIPCGS